MNELIYPPSMSFWRALQAGYVEPLESEKYLDFVRSIPSVLSGQRPCVAHHLCGHGLKAKGGKVSDLMTFPLIDAEHMSSRAALHVLGSTEWEKRNQDQRIYVMQTLIEAVYRGVLVVGK